MLQSLYNREQGLVNSKSFSSWFSTKFCNQIDLSFKSFEKVFQSSINCIDLETNDYRYSLVGYGNGGISIFDVDWNESLIYPSVGAIDRSSNDGHKFSIDCLQWYPHDTGMFLSLSADQVLNIWDTNEFKVAEKFRFQSDVYNFHMSTKSKRHSTVAVASKDKNIYLCDLKSGSKSHVLLGHTGAVLTVKWSPRNEYILCSGGTDGHIFMWDFRKAKSNLASFHTDVISKESNQKVAHSGNVTSLCYLNDGLSFLSFGTDNKLKLWDVIGEADTKHNYGLIPNSAQRTIQLAITEHLGNNIVFVPTSVSVNIHEIQSAKYVNSLSGHFMSVNCCCFNPIQQEMYSGSSDRQILTWDFPRNIYEDNNIFKDSWSSDK